MNRITQALVKRFGIPTLLMMIFQVFYGPSSLTGKDLSVSQQSKNLYSLTTIDTELHGVTAVSLDLLVPGADNMLGTEELLIISFKQMLAHLGQKFTLYVKDLSSGEVLDSVVIESVAEQDFDVQSSVIEVGGSYQIDFWADLNENGQYDAPPSDHAWRLLLEDVEGDTTIEFVHNGSFTDIMEGGSTWINSGVADAEFHVYPNPARSNVFLESEKEMVEVRIYSFDGKLLRLFKDKGSKHLQVPMETLPAGTYLLKVRLSDRTDRFMRFVRER